MSFLAARQIYIAFSCVVSFEIRCWNAGWLVFLWDELKVMNDGCFVDWMILCNTIGHELIDMICYVMLWLLYCMVQYRIMLDNGQCCISRTAWNSKWTLILKLKLKFNYYRNFACGELGF